MREEIICIPRRSCCSIITLWVNEKKFGFCWAVILVALYDNMNNLLSDATSKTKSVKQLVHDVSVGMSWVRNHMNSTELEGFPRTTAQVLTVDWLYDKT